MMRTNKDIHDIASERAATNPRGAIQMTAGELAAVVSAVKESVADWAANEALSGYVSEYSFAFNYQPSEILVTSTAKVLAMTNALFGVQATVVPPGAHVSRRERRRQREENATEDKTAETSESENEPDVPGE